MQNSVWQKRTQSRKYIISVSAYYNGFSNVEIFVLHKFKKNIGIVATSSLSQFIMNSVACSAVYRQGRAFAIKKNPQNNNKKQTKNHDHERI